MLDFLLISSRLTKNGVIVSPKFRLYPKSKDLMIRGRDFYAVWNEETALVLSSISQRQLRSVRLVEEDCITYVS